MEEGVYKGRKLDRVRETILFTEKYLIKTSKLVGIKTNI